MSLADLRARYLAQQAPDRVARAESAALLACAVAVYEAAGARREAAERAVELALEALAQARAVENEWACTCHGLALRHAIGIDCGEAIAFLTDSADDGT